MYRQPSPPEPVIETPPIKREPDRLGRGCIGVSIGAFFVVWFVVEYGWLAFCIGGPLTCVDFSEHPTLGKLPIVMGFGIAFAVIFYLARSFNHGSDAENNVESCGRDHAPEASTRRPGVEQVPPGPPGRSEIFPPGATSRCFRPRSPSPSSPRASRGCTPPSPPTPPSSPPRSCRLNRGSRTIERRWGGHRLWIGDWSRSRGDGSRASGVNRWPGHLVLTRGPRRTIRPRSAGPTPGWWAWFAEEPPPRWTQVAVAQQRRP